MLNLSRALLKFEAAEAGLELLSSRLVAFFIKVSSELVKIPSSARWLVEAELVDPVDEMDEVATFSLGSRPEWLVWARGKLMNLS